MDPSPNRPPVRPAFEGTEIISTGDARFTYTVGRDFVKDSLRDMLMSREPIAIDIETEGLGASALNLKSVSFGTTTSAVICDPRDPCQRDLIKKSLAFARALLFWNSAYDAPNLARNALLGVKECAKVTDGLLYARLAEPSEIVRKSLTDSWERWAGSGDVGQATDQNKQMFRLMGVRTKVEGFKQADLHMPAFVHAAAYDVIRTARLVPVARQRAYDRLTKGHPYADEGVSGRDAWRLTDREQHLNRMFLRRSVKGLRVDLEYLDAYRDQNQAQIDEMTHRLEQAGITVTNASTLFEVLEREGTLPADHPRTPTGKHKATADVLEAMHHPLAQAFVERKKLVKNDEDYLDKVVELASSAGRIHPDVKLLGATTGRMSIGTPPLQQFPEPARGIVLADNGDGLTSIDWSQIEPVIAANLAGEHEVVARYEDPAVKADLYLPVAEKAGIERKQAKTVLLGLLYGLGVVKLADQLGCSVDDAQDLSLSVFKVMPRVANWTRQLRREGERHMKVITLSGRILPVPMGTYHGRTSVQTHKAINFTVQGSAYDLLADCLIAIENAGLGDTVYLAMHDELIVSTEAANDVRKLMEAPPPRLCEFAERDVVLRTDRLDLGERWAAA
ncbi:MAG: DNA polymerase [Pseudonocardiaceae bacterium]